MSQDLKQRRSKVERDCTVLSMTRQCELLNIHRSGLYYQPRGESELNLELMRLIDEQHMLRPWYGVERMTRWLKMDKGFTVNEKRIRRLYRVMDIQGMAPKPNTSKPGKGHRVYPYLLRNLKIERPNHVWAIDISYIPVQRGYLYLVAIIDLYSRYVVGWSLSNSMTADWCCNVLREAVENHGKPEIINSDQGSQFTSEAFAGCVTEELKITLSMDGKGRAIDNVFVERLWRSVKYEQVYLFPATDGLEAYQGLDIYFRYYNTQRRHKSLDGRIPQQVFQQPINLAA